MIKEKDLQNRSKLIKTRISLINKILTFMHNTIMGNQAIINKLYILQKMIDFLRRKVKEVIMKRLMKVPSKSPKEIIINNLNSKICEIQEIIHSKCSNRQVEFMLEETDHQNQRKKHTLSQLK